MELPDKLAKILCDHVKVRYDIDGIDMTIGFETGYRTCFKELESLILASKAVAKAINNHSYVDVSVVLDSAIELDEALKKAGIE